MSDYFADDASLFSVINGINVFAAELNEDLKKVSNGLLNGKWFLIQMLVNKLKKLYLVWKEKKPIHPPQIFNNAIVSQTNSQKHLGVTFNAKLLFDEHLLNVIKKVNRTRGLWCKLQSELPRII